MGTTRLGHSASTCLAWSCLCRRSLQVGCDGCSSGGRYRCGGRWVARAFPLMFGCIAGCCYLQLTRPGRRLPRLFKASACSTWSGAVGLFRALLPLRLKRHKPSSCMAPPLPSLQRGGAVRLRPHGIVPGRQPRPCAAPRTRRHAHAPQVGRRALAHHCPTPPTP